MNFNLKLKRYRAGEGPRYIARPRVVLQVAAAPRTHLPHPRLALLLLLLRLLLFFFSVVIVVVFFFLLFYFTKLDLSFTRLLHFRAPCVELLKGDILSLSLLLAIISLAVSLTLGNARGAPDSSWLAIELMTDGRHREHH